MKRALFVAIGLLAAPALVSAQMTLGVGGGIVSSTFTGSDAGDAESQTGFRAGAWLAIPIADRLSVVPGASYVQKGASFTEPGVGTGSLDVSYFEIPVLLAVRLTPAGSAVGFNVFAGPSVAIEASCSISGEAGGVSASVDCPPADQDDRQTLDLGALVGGNVVFPVGERFALLLSGGVDLGLRTLDTSADPDDVKHRAFSGSVSFAIPLGG